MQTLRVNGYDMAYLEVGEGPPLVCVHGTLGDFRTWYAVLGPLSKTRRVIALSLRRFFPEHWDGVGTDYLMSQHVSDVIGFIERLETRPVDLMGHSRGGHIGFRVAQQRPDLLRRLVLAEPGGDLDPTLGPVGTPSGLSQAARTSAMVDKIGNGDIDGALALFVEMCDGDGAWARLPAVSRQQLRDNIFTLIGQVGREPQTLCEKRSRIDQDADAVDRRRRHARRVVTKLARAREAYSGRKDRNYPRHAPLDVRTGAGGIFTNRAGVSR